MTYLQIESFIPILPILHKALCYHVSTTNQRNLSTSTSRYSFTNSFIHALPSNRKLTKVLKANTKKKNRNKILNVRSKCSRQTLNNCQRVANIKKTFILSYQLIL